MIRRVHWHTKASRYAETVLHLGVRVWRWRFEIHSGKVETNIQDGAERFGWPKRSSEQ